MVAIPIRLMKEAPREDALKVLGKRSHVRTVRNIIASRRAMVGEKQMPLLDENPDAFLARHPEAHRLTKSQREELINKLGDDIFDFDRVTSEASRMRITSDCLKSKLADSAH